MQTVRQIERLWGQGRFTQLFSNLVEARSEQAFANHLQANHPGTAAAAMAIIRLEELSQSHAQLHHSLLRAVLGSQESDGGWGDPMLTALCLRALFANNGRGDAIARGLQYLEALQQPAGIWPKIALRRLPGDPLTTAFILNQLSEQRTFRDAIDFDAVTDWFDTHQASLDMQTRKLWARVNLRSGQWRTTTGNAEKRLALLWT